MSDAPAPSRLVLGMERGFVAFLAIVAMTVLVFAVPPLRAPVVALLTFPATLFGWIAPGATPYDDARIAAGLLGWAGWALSPLLILPLLVLALYAAGLKALAVRFATPLERLADAADAVCGAVGAFAYWLSAALVAVVGTVVVQRYVFGIAFTKLQELIVYLHAALFLLAAAATLKADGHVRVDVIYSRLSVRMRAIINLIGAYLLLGVTCLVVLGASRGFVDAAWRVTEGSAQADGLPLVYLLKTLVPVFAILMIAQAASLAGRSALMLMGEGEDHIAAHSEHHEAV